MRTYLVCGKWVKGMHREDTRFGSRCLRCVPRRVLWDRQLRMSLHNWRDNQFSRSEPDEGVVLVSILLVRCLLIVAGASFLLKM